VFRKVAVGNLNLAAAADRSTTTNGVDIHAQATCGIQNWRRAGKTAALARRHEDDQRVFFVIVRHSRASCVHGFGRRDVLAVRDCLRSGHDSRQSSLHIRRRAP